MQGPTFNLHRTLTASGIIREPRGYWSAYSRQAERIPKRRLCCREYKRQPPKRTPPLEFIRSEVMGMSSIRHRVMMTALLLSMQTFVCTPAFSDPYQSKKAIRNQ